ncbi:MAG: outer membrane beta-barrel protein [Saprospiraceae bacterium]|nr:outer membrane beta-barrel protein [Saprospiraceae bacterium]
MKDSFNNPMDKQLADKGWADMKSLLDREMPVQRKRRRGIVWMVQLAAALLLPILGIGAWWFTIQEPNITPGIASGTTTPTITSNKPSINTGAFHAEVSEQQAALIPDQNTTFPTPINPVSKSLSTASTFKGQTSNIDVFPAPQDGALGAQAKNFEPTQANSNTSQIQTSNNSTPASATTFQALQQPESNVAAQYPRQVVFPNTLSMPDTMATTEPQQNKAPQASWAFGAGAGIQSSTDFNGLNGALAGVNVDYNLNRKFGMRSGLNYQAFQPDNSERPIASISAASYTDATGFEDFGGGAFGTASADMQVDVPVARLHRVEAPLLAYWQPVKMLRLYGGMRLGYNLYAQSAQRAQTEFGAFDTPNSGAEKRALNQNLTKDLPNWDPSWSGGLGIGIGKRAEIGLFYNHPWKSEKQQETLDSFLPGPATNAGNATPGNTNASSFQFSATVYF